MGVAARAARAWALLSALALLRDGGGRGGGLASAKLVKGRLDTLSSWHYMTRFAFLPVPRDVDVNNELERKKYGRFEFEIMYNTGDRPSIALYFFGASSSSSCFQTPHDA